MSKVLTFSRKYPTYHPKAGQPTYFVEKIWESVRHNWLTNGIPSLSELNKGKNKEVELLLKSLDQTTQFKQKAHTIRSGARFKKCDWFSPRVWSGQPYNSPQIIFSEDIMVEQVFDFEIEVDGGFASKFFLNDKRVSPDFLLEIS